MLQVVVLLAIILAFILINGSTIGRTLKIIDNVLLVCIVILLLLLSGWLHKF